MNKFAKKQPQKFAKKQPPAEAPIKGIKVVIPPSGTEFTLSRLGEDYQSDSMLAREGSARTSTPAKLHKVLKMRKEYKDAIYTVELHVWNHHLRCWVLVHNKDKGVCRVIAQVASPVAAGTHEDRKDALRRVAEAISVTLPILLDKANLP